MRCGRSSTTALRSGGVLGLGLILVGRVPLSELSVRGDRMAADLAFGVLGVGALIASLLLVMSAFGAPVAPLVDTLSAFTPGQRAQMLLIGIIAGAGEETLFRPYLQPALCARPGSGKGLA